MKSVRLLAWMAILLGTALNGSFARASGEQPLELSIQMIPGIWISGATGAVSIEYTTNLDQPSGWAMLANVQATNSPYFYIDATATNAPQRFYRAVSILNLNPDPQHLVWAEPGTFMMGSPSTEQDRYSNEGPQTRVTISKGFWINKYETTQEEYSAVVRSNPSYFTGDLNRPVEQVSWDDANNYCGKLTVRERAMGRLPAGYEYRLPTEAEWEYACRAGTTTATAYGDSLTSIQANFAGNYPYGGTAEGPYLNCTSAVGSYAPNAWGLYDMHGNVWEWCLDWYGTYSGTSVTDPRGTTTGSFCDGDFLGVQEFLWIVPQVSGDCGDSLNSGFFCAGPKRFDFGCRNLLCWFRWIPGASDGFVLVVSEGPFPGWRHSLLRFGFLALLWAVFILIGRFSMDRRRIAWFLRGGRGSPRKYFLAVSFVVTGKFPQAVPEFSAVLTSWLQHRLDFALFSSMPISSRAMGLH